MALLKDVRVGVLVEDGCRFDRIIAARAAELLHVDVEEKAESKVSLIPSLRRSTLAPLLKVPRHRAVT